MANPWHDGEGKFCSQGEMKKAVDKLASAGDLEGYFKLRKEYEDIEQRKVTVSEDYLSSIATSGISLFGNREATVEDVETMYRILKPELKTNDHINYNVIALIEDPTTPAHIKDDILANAGADLKAQIMNKFENDDSFTDVDVKKLIAGETDERLIAYAARSKKLTFEDRYKIAQQSDRGLADLAYNNAKIFFAVPELEDELLAKANSLAAAGKSEDANYAYLVLGRNSSNQSTQQDVLDNSTDTEFTYMDPYEQLAKNPKINEKVLVNLVEKMSTHNVRDFKDLAETITSTLEQNRRRGGNAYWRSRQDYQKVTLDTHPVFTPEEVQEMDDLRAEKNKGTYTQSKALRLGALQAAMDCYAPNYKELHARYKAFGKRNAPKVDSFGDTSEILERRLINAQNYTQTLAFLNTLKDYFKD